MNYVIEPYVGVGSLRFGMTAKEVRQMIDTPPEPFNKEKDNPHPADLFKQPGIAAYYTAKGECEAIEFSGPAMPLYDDKVLLDMPQADAENWIRQVDPDSEIALPDITSYKLGIAFFVREERVATVLAFRRGYFSQ